MAKYNKWINRFSTQSEYDDYINGSIAEFPNVGYVDATDKVMYSNQAPNDHIIFGETTGTTDFSIGSGSNRIDLHVVTGDTVNYFYADESDVHGTITSLRNAFNTTQGKKITKLLKWKWDTSNVTDMSNMFSGCSALNSVDLSSFDTSNITDMGAMFYNCYALTSLDLNNFDTSSVTNMGAMFYNCNRLTSLDVSSFDTSSVARMGGMFHNCSILTSLDLNNFDTSSVTSMSKMFYGCISLASLDVSSFDTSSVARMDSMFRDCYALTSIDLSLFDTSNVTIMEYMFASCRALTSLDLSSFDTSSVTNMYGMFASSNALTSITLSSDFFNSATVTSYPFYVSNWRNTDSLATFVTAITAHDGTGKTVELSYTTKNALTQEQKDAITAAGWTISYL